MDDHTDDTQKQEPKSKYDLDQDYANNTFIEASVWDLKIIFGQINQFGKSAIEVDWHTAITMPWAVAKLLHHVLGIHIDVHELQNGKIKIPPTLVPPEAIPPEEGNPLSQTVHEIISKRREEFLATL